MAPVSDFDPRKTGSASSRALATLALLLGLGMPSCSQSESCEHGEHYCDGSRAFSCSSEELVWQNTDCAETGKYCASGKKSSFCAIRPEKDDRCPNVVDESRSPDEGSGWCENDAPVYCDQGYPISYQTCKVCIAIETTAFCAESDVRDPLCPQKSGRSGYCTEDNGLVVCRDGYRVFHKDCNDSDEPRQCNGAVCLLISGN
jgi:hypothetical protein